jgi:hypothetical protein
VLGIAGGVAADAVAPLGDLGGSVGASLSLLGVGSLVDESRQSPFTNFQFDGQCSWRVLLLDRVGPNLRRAGQTQAGESQSGQPVNSARDDAMDVAPRLPKHQANLAQNRQ